MAGIRRPLHLCKFLPGAIILLMLPFFGCGEKSTKNYKSGMLWVVNNLCPGTYLTGGRWLRVQWEGEEIEIPNNMDLDGNGTGVGAVNITTEPLLGGTEVDFVFSFNFGGETRTRSLSEVLPAGQRAIIDGDITIDVYSRIWGDRLFVDAEVQILAEKCDEIHFYPDM